MPPEQKIETRMRFSPAASAAAIPASSARGASAAPPKTASARPLERARNDRRDRPVPAGSGMPASIARRPRPAVAAPAPRRSSEREKPAQPHAREEKVEVESG